MTMDMKSLNIDARLIIRYSYLPFSGVLEKNVQSWTTHLSIALF